MHCADSCIPSLVVSMVDASEKQNGVSNDPVKRNAKNIKIQVRVQTPFTTMDQSSYPTPLVYPPL